MLYTLPLPDLPTERRRAQWNGPLFRGLIRLYNPRYLAAENYQKDQAEDQQYCQNNYFSHKVRSPPFPFWFINTL